MNPNTVIRAKHALYASVALAERAMRRPMQTPPVALRNFLLLQYPAALGTAIHATPVAAALRAAVPQARIVVAAAGFGAVVYRNNPAVDLLLETPDPYTRPADAVRMLRRQNVFAGEPYATITTKGTERTGTSMLALLAGPSWRVGFTVAPQLYQQPLAYDVTRSLIENNLDTVRALGHAAPPLEPRLFPSAGDEAHAEDLLAAEGLLDGKPIAVFVTQTSVTQRKSWRPERFAAAARHMRERHGAHILFVGTESESAAIDGIRALLGFAGASLAGKTSIGVLAAVLRRCRIGITLDTGTLHIGRSAGLPMVIVAPAWSPVIEWLPVGNPRYRILKNADMPAATPEYIIDEVSVDEVTAAADALMPETASR